jgi:acetate kinase
MNILVPNLGSTSLKYRIFEMPDERIILDGRLERVTDYENAVSQIPWRDAAVDAVAFKTVHGGPRYRSTVRIDTEVIAALEAYRSAAPAHNDLYLRAIRAFQRAAPHLPLIAAFETEFHASIPSWRRSYGVPAHWREMGVERYGFHGASHQFVSERVPALLVASPARLRLVSCHLGGSSSLCAIQEGRSCETTMGFSPQSGLDHATRPGDLDPFAVLSIMERHGWSPEETRAHLCSESGLAGRSGIPGGDVRDLEAAAARGVNDFRQL